MLSFLNRFRDGFLTEGASDLFESVEGAGGVLNEIDVGETAFTEKGEDFKGAGVDGEVRGGRKAGDAGCEGVDDVEKVLLEGGHFGGSEGRRSGLAGGGGGSGGRE